jgi:hypothetical protein
MPRQALTKGTDRCNLVAYCNIRRTRARPRSSEYVLHPYGHLA